MATARRLYLYGAAVTSLVALVGGLQRLLVFVIDQLATALGPAPIAGDVAQSLDGLSLAVSVIALALPVWALHWWAAERLAARGGGVGSDAGSVVRAVHFLLVRQLSLAAFLIALLAFVGWVIAALLAVDSGDEPVGDSLALATIAGCTWAYHTWLRRRDLRRDEIVGGAAAVARLDRHLGAAIGLVVAAFATSDVIMISLRLAVDRPLDGAPDWWQVPSPTGSPAASSASGHSSSTIRKFDPRSPRRASSGKTTEVRVSGRRGWACSCSSRPGPRSRRRRSPSSRS